MPGRVARNDAPQVDKATFGARDDLARDREDVSVEELGLGAGETRSDHFEEVVDNEGRVAYGKLASKEDDLDDYLAQIARADRASLSRHEDLALLLNAYNACTLKLILEYRGISSIKDIPSGKRWEDRRWTVGGETVCLEHLEHVMIREGFTERKIHFALVCAANGCPPLRREPYLGKYLVDQFDDQMRRFFASPGNLQYVTEGRIIRISELFDWYRSDLTAGDVTVRDWVVRHGPEETVRLILLAGPRIEVEYIPYDWRLNGSW